MSFSFSAPSRRAFTYFSLLAGLLLVPALSPAQDFVQVNNNTVATNASSVSVSYPTAETAGDLNIVVVGWNDTSSSVTSVVDDDTNSYVLVGTTAGHGLSQAIYYSRSIVLPNSATPTVTVAFNQTAAFPDVRVLEYRGLSATAPLDIWAGDSGASTAANSGPATTTSNDLILGAGTTASAFTAADPTLTARVITTPFGDIVEDSAAPKPAGIFNGAAPIASSNSWVMQVVGFSVTAINFANPPTISATTPITPASGPDVGGTSVTITGTNFQPGAVVLFGTAPSAISGVNCSESGGTTITCLTPSGTDGATDVKIANVDGQSSSAAAAYTFFSVIPTINTITPATGPTNGGTQVTVAGGNFQAGANLVIGGLPAADVVVQDNATITANVPAIPVGPADVTVNNPGGGVATQTGAFTYASSVGPVNYIQRGGAATAGTATTLATTMSSPQTAASLNVVIIGWNDVAANVTSVTDTEGNTYAAALPVKTGTALSQVIYYAKNIIGDVLTPNQITVTFSQAAQAPDVQVFEYSGVIITNPIDAVAGNSGSGNLADSGACTTTAAVELIVAGAAVSTSVTSAGAGFNLLNITQPNRDGAEHQITSVAGSCDATIPISSGGNWVIQTVAFKLIPGPAPDFNLSAIPGSQSVVSGTSAASVISVIGVNGFNSTVALTCDPASLPAGASCAFSPTSVVPGATSALTIITSTSTPAGTSNVTVTGTGGVSHSTSFSLTITAAPAADFTIAASAMTPASVSAGGSATSTITIAPVPLSGFNGTVILSCSVAPVVTRPATCALNPGSVPNGSGTSMLTVSTTAPTTASLAPQLSGIFYAIWLPVAGLALLGTDFTPRKKRILGCMLFSGLIIISACGGSSSSGGAGHPGTPAGAYTITITGAGPLGTPTHSTTTTLTVN